MARIANIVADILLVVITWKFLPGGMKTKGLARIMLCDGVSGPPFELSVFKSVNYLDRYTLLCVRHSRFRRI